MLADVFDSYNMSILEVGDATEVESVLDVTETIDGPVYICMLRGEVPRSFPKASAMLPQYSWA
jgi:transketolase